MSRRLACLVLLTLAAGCTKLSGGPSTASFPVFFAPYSADLDQQALDAVHSASDFAKANARQPVILIGYSAPPDPGKDTPGLSDKRAEAVRAALVSDGISSNRISAVGQGTTAPKANMPSVSVRRVDISVGQLPPN
ncbi:MAG: OmpA family protein [Rhodopila sp.]